MILRNFYFYILYGNIPDIEIIADMAIVTISVAIFQHSFFS